MSVTHHGLAGQRILITRPVAQAQHLSDWVQQAQAVAIRLPVIHIQANYPANISQILHSFSHAQYAMSIFISGNAVHYCDLYLTQQNWQLASSSQLTAVGKRTKLALQAQYPQAILCAPPPYNSDTLLTLPALQSDAIQGKRILILKGEGGRKLLAETLMQRGAKVDTCSLYQRVCPDFPTPYPDWYTQQSLDQVVITSAQGIQHLLHMLPDTTWLLNKDWVVISPRLKPLLQRLGVVGKIKIAREASDQALLTALQSV